MNSQTSDNRFRLRTAKSSRESSASPTRMLHSVHSLAACVAVLGFLAGAPVKLTASTSDAMMPQGAAGRLRKGSPSKCKRTEQREQACTTSRRPSSALVACHRKGCTNQCSINRLQPCQCKMRWVCRSPYFCSNVRTKHSMPHMPGM